MGRKNVRIAPVTAPNVDEVAAAVAASSQVIKDLDLPKLELLSPEPYLEGLGIKTEHIAASNIRDGRVVIVTKGGRKLAFPGDEARAVELTESEKDGVARTEPKRANLMGRAK